MGYFQKFSILSLNVFLTFLLPKPIHFVLIKNVYLKMRRGCTWFRARKACISYHSPPFNRPRDTFASLYFRFNSTWISLTLGKGIPTYKENVLWCSYLLGLFYTPANFHTILLNQALIQCLPLTLALITTETKNYVNKGRPKMSE